jgi:hypothetical protein
MVLILREYPACIKFNAQLPIFILLTDLHAHPFVEVIDVLRVDALREGFIFLAAGVGFGAKLVVVGLPKVEDRCRAVLVAAAVGVALVQCAVAAALPKGRVVY